MQVTQIRNQAAELALAQSEGLAKSLQEISNQLATINLDEADPKQLGSAFLISQISNLPFIDGWREKVSIIRDFPSKYPKGHIKVDFQSRLTSDSGSCLTLELFADNREALGTNLLKLQIANEVNGVIGETLGIGIVLSATLKKAGWDGSVATEDEYEYAMRHTYAKFILTPVVLLAVDF
jgi:hypothetical protein